jgi:DNA-binding transcriptional ArsR family regulator
VKAINEINDPRLVKALAHPLRVSILSALEHRVASPSELAEELGVPLPNLSYHIRMLVQLDMLKLVKTRPRRGAIEHYYQAKGRISVTDKAWGEVPTVVKEAMISATLAQIAETVGAAAARGGFDAPDAHISRQPIKLDDQGWKELSKKIEVLFRDVQRIAGEAEKRRKASDHLDEIDAAVVLMLFKAAPVDAAQPRADDGTGVHKRAPRSSRSRTRQRGSA